MYQPRRIENVRCDDHANGYPGAFGTHCRDCIKAQEAALVALRALPPMPDALAERLGFDCMSDEVRAEIDTVRGVEQTHQKDAAA